MSFRHSLELGDPSFPDELYDSDEAREAFLAQVDAEGIEQVYACASCGLPVMEDDTVWGTPDGAAHGPPLGDPYHVECLPEERQGG